MDGTARGYFVFRREAAVKRKAGGKVSTVDGLTS